MENGSSFIELAHMNFVLKNIVEMLHTMLNNAEKNILIKERQIISVLLTSGSKRENFMECDGMLAVYIPYIMYRWKTTDPRGC